MAIKFTMSIPDAMREAIELERKQRRLDSVQQTIRAILQEYFRRASDK